MDWLKLFTWISAAAAVLTAYFGLVLASNLSEPKYLMLLIPAGLLGILARILFSKISRQRLLEQLRRAWGASEKPEKKHNFKEIELYFKLAGKETAFAIDDRTWADLTGDEIFKYIDRTCTVVGQQYLYKLLRTPVFELDELKRRSQLIEIFQSNPGLREQIQVALTKLKDASPTAIEMVWEPPALPSLRYGWAYNLLFYSACAAPVILLFSLPFGVLVVIAIFIINLFIHNKMHKRISGFFHTIRTLTVLVELAGKLAAVQELHRTYDAPRVTNALKRAKGFQRIASTIGLESADPILGSLLQYLSIYFLLDVRGFERAIAQVRQNRSELLCLYQWVGELDALQAAASYRDSLAYYCEPELKIGVSSNDPEKLIGVEMYHPLLREPVPNSLTIGEKGILITGSNMSGKSTFLRTVGVNALFAQSIFTCFARRYSSRFVKLMTVIGRADNLIEGKSYYLVEAQSILRIIKEIETDNKTVIMAIFDEMYRGTNSEERITAGFRVLKFAAQKHTVILAATHDLELTEMLTKQYVNYHFREKIGEYGLEFDYTLKPGPSQTRNAIELLKILGYPKEITG